MKTRNRIWLTILPILLISFGVMGLLIVTTFTSLHSGHLTTARKLAMLETAAETALDHMASDQSPSGNEALLKSHIHQALVAVRRQAEDSRRNTLELLRFLTGASAALLAAALLAGYLMATHIAKPTALLGAYARRIAKGDFTPITPIGGSSEIRELALDIDHMRARMHEHITDRDRLIAERTEDLERKSRHLKAVFESSPTGILRVDDRGHILDANPAMANMLGYSTAELCQMSIKDITYPSDWPADKAAFTATLNGLGGDEERENRYVHCDGSIRWGRIARNAVRREDGTVEFVVGVVTDVGERKHHEEELADRERAYRLLFSSMSAGFALQEIICNAEGRPVDYRFLEVNPAFEALTGLKYEDIVGRTAIQVTPTMDSFWLDTFGAVALSGQATHFEHFNEDVGKHFFVTAYCPQKGRFAVILTDITWQKQAEEEHRRLARQVQHAQKLESLGVLAGGIAHDFNNLLMGILGNADLAASQVAASAPIRRELEEIEKSAKRAAELCRQMLAYSGRAQFTVEPVNLAELVRDMHGMLKMSVAKNVEFKVELPDDLPYVEADATQVRQILMNLVINASEAIGGRPGSVTVRTGSRPCSRAFLRDTYLDDELPEGNYVSIEVSDNGCGMEPQILDRIFEPFFTTKFAGRGLGMAAVLGIIQGHRGAIKIESEPGKGTTFLVLLPAMEQAPEKPAIPITVEPVAVAGRGSILVADDEDVVRRVAGVMLERAGYEATTVTNGREALELLQSRHFDCIVLDLTMPVMGGEETLRQIRQQGLTIPVFMSSGYSEQEFRININQDWVSGFLQKPYRSEDLLAALQRVL